MPNPIEVLFTAAHEDPAVLGHLHNDALGEILEAHGVDPTGKTKAERIELITAMVSTGAEPQQPQSDLADVTQVRITEPVVTVPTSQKQTPGQLLNAMIGERTNAVSYKTYAEYLEQAFCGSYGAEENSTKSPYFGVDAYEHLRNATEAFLMCEVGTLAGEVNETRRDQRRDILARIGRDPGEWRDVVREYRTDYLRELREGAATLPYYERIIEALEGLPLKQAVLVPDDGCYGIVKSRVSPPCMVELLWSYWLEEGLLMQAMNAISLRFQNRRSSDRNPLAHLEIAPLRPLNNLIWGWIQDEPRRLSVVRRAYEYDHHYGLRIQGKAVPDLQPADSRTNFLEAFHNLLYLTTVFYKEEDDRNYDADGFPVLNALRELHVILAHGAHNQFADLPWQARSEMLIVQWLMSRPEMGDFLGGRAMVPYPEPWMGRVDTMTSLQGWGVGGVTPFRDLAVYGEKIILSVRYEDWVGITDTNEASNWAKFWRSEIQRYVHAYRSVTGVDLTADPIHQEQMRKRFMQPSQLLAGRNGDRSTHTAAPS